MTITIENKEIYTIIKLDGRLDTANAPDFERQVLPLAEELKTELIIECEKLNYISSAGLRQFLMLQKAVASKNGKMRIQNMHPEIKDIFDLTGFSSMFIIE